MKEKIITKENANAEELRLMETFKFDTLHIEPRRDAGGKYYHIKELKTCLYCLTEKHLYECFNEIVDTYKNATSKKTLQQLRKLAKKDNAHAEYLGLRQWKPIEVKKLSDGFYGVIIEFENGERHNFVESSLSYYLKNEQKTKEYVNWNRRYFTAGGLEDNDVDFIFNGVGHSTKKELYTFNHGFEVVA